ncbi:MAG: carboxypeptidase M32 [Magnetospiraceae bacterium]
MDTQTLPTAYTALYDRFRRIALVGEALGHLDWDLNTMMPPGGAETRAEQLSTLAALRHGMITDPALADLLNAAEAAGGLDPWHAANLREMRRNWRHANALETDLVEAMTRAGATCERVWREARPEADFAKVLPNLREVLRLSQEAAAAKAEALGCAPYDALLDQYEPDGRSADIDVLFADLEAFLPDFLGQALDHQKAMPAPVLPAGPFPVDIQKSLGEQLMGAIGFDFNHGRLDESLHPFSGGTPDDLRITTRYDEADFTTALMGVLHETGHALYEHQLPKPWRWQPVGDARGMSIHESQSLLLEMQVCRSRAFLDFAAPLMRAAFNGTGAAWSVENLTRIYTQVKPDFIRVDADEVTYPAHVILRYRLERKLIDGAMDLADLPSAWNEGMEQLLGIRPPDDRLGCLQDIHWYDGAWGYFPTYTLGAMAAAQLYQAALRDVPGIPGAVAAGDFKPLMGWLRDHVHGQGSKLSTTGLMAAATGAPLGTEALKAHLTRRYLA